MDILKNKNVITLLVVVVVALLVYYLWNSAGNGALLSTTEEASPLSQEILTTLGQLHTLHLDPAVFKDPVFMSLSDFGTTIPPQQAGRRNPFAPVGAVQKTASSTPAR